MDEFDAVLRARRLSKSLTADQIPVPLDWYLKQLSAEMGEIVVRYDHSLGNDEGGHTLVVAGKRCIVINGNDRPERQRFTAFHEIAHIVLGLPTEHGSGGSQFARRSPNEILCDVFAAELLLPFHLFQPMVEESDFGFDAIERLAEEFEASLAATGSRFAAVCDRPCAFVLTLKGTVRHAPRSKAMREIGAWVRPGQKVPEFSLAGHLVRSSTVEGPIEVSADEWFEDWKRGGLVMEDARHFTRWQQTMSMLWFEDDRVPTSRGSGDDDDDEEPALRPLDGVLPWPGRSRRRP